MGPLYNVNIVNNPTSKFAFVEFVDESSVIYACRMMQGLKLFGKYVTVKPRSKTAKDREWMLFQKKQSNRNGNSDYSRSAPYDKDHHQNQRNQYSDSTPIHIPDRHGSGGRNFFNRNSYGGSADRLHSFVPRQDRFWADSPRNPPHFQQSYDHHDRRNEDYSYHRRSSSDNRKRHR
ncbi:hypothetical protein FO519_009386 [Halicephalobus sp. NKZ332]|nr:hypothetical protein FO519_009386 [Halicephalobus sp. NKZ332]